MKRASKQQAEDLRRMALRAMERADKIEQLPDESIFEDGDVIKYKRRFRPQDEVAYTYVADKIAATDRWAVSSTRGADYMTWDELCNLVIDGQIEKMWVCAKWSKVALP